MREAQRVLDSDIDARAAGIVRTHPGWPCRKGCDACCRRLASAPSLTAPEWERLREGLDALPAAVRAAVLARIEAMPDVPPLTCPMLDREAGACLVYAHRPAACRTYGYYQERDRGLYCQELHGRVDAGEFSGAVWGNAAAVEARLRGFGAARGLREWLAR